MKKVSELVGIDLDYWVAKAEGFEKVGIESYMTNPPKPIGCWVLFAGVKSHFSPTQRWSQAGVIITARNIGLEGKSAWAWKDGICIGFTGESTLEAAMRVVVALEFGSEVDEKTGD